MNKLFNLIIIAFLVAYSLQEYDIDLSEFAGSSFYAELMNCFDHNDTSTCKNVPMTSGVYQCCKVEIILPTNSREGESSYDDEDEDHEHCSVWSAQDLTDEQIKLMQRSYQEAVTFLYLNYDYYMYSFSMTYTCQRKTYTLNYGGGEFTEQEKNIMKDKNYCLRLYYEGLAELIQMGEIIGYGDEPRKITKDICMNGKTLPSSGNTCAYASFNLKLFDGTSQRISTCTLVNSAAYDTQSLDKLLEEDFKKIWQIDGKTIKSYDVEITDKDGKVMKYDSLTQSVKVENGSEKLRKSLLILFSLLIILL